MNKRVFIGILASLLLPIYLEAETDFFELCQSGTAAEITKALKAGADAKARDKNGQTALDYAKKNENLKGTKAYWALNDAQY